jgi:hypothetical protein
MQGCVRKALALDGRHGFFERFVLHPAGEVVFSFPTYGGPVRLCPTGDALTPFAGLVPWAAFQNRSVMAPEPVWARDHAKTLNQVSG